MCLKCVEEWRQVWWWWWWSWGQIPTQCQSNEQVFRSDFINYNENVKLTNLNDDVIGFYIANVHTVTDYGYPLTIRQPTGRPPRFR